MINPAEFNPMKHSPALFLFLTTLLSLTACESNAEKSARLERERQARIERERQEMVEQEERRRKQEIFLEFPETASNAAQHLGQIALDTPTHAMAVVALKLS